MVQSVMLSSSSSTTTTAIIMNSILAVYYSPSEGHHGSHNKARSNKYDHRRISKFRQCQRIRRNHSTATTTACYSHVPILVIMSFIIISMGGGQQQQQPCFFASSMLIRLPAETTAMRYDHYGYHHHCNDRGGRDHCNISSRVNSRAPPPPTTTSLHLKVDPTGNYLSRLSNNNNSRRNGRRAPPTTATSLYLEDSTSKYLNLLSSSNNNNMTTSIATTDDDDDDDYEDSILMPIRTPEEAPVLEELFKEESLEEGGSLDTTNTSGASMEIISSGGEAIPSNSVGRDVVAHPNEEPPLSTVDEEYEDTEISAPSTIYENAIKSSKFDSITDPELVKKLPLKSPSNSISIKDNDSESESSNEDSSKNNNQGIKAMFQNLLGNDKDNNKSQEQTERTRKWSEWMSTGKPVKVRSGSSSNNDNGVAFDESLLSLDKGDDYVVVAVPAEAVTDGVGPILSSFPGGQLFQKSIGKTFQEVIVNGGTVEGIASLVGGGGGGGEKNATTYSPSSTISNGTNEKKVIKQKSTATITLEKKKKKKTEEQLKKEKIQQKHKQQKEREARHNKLQHGREPGRVSSGDWRRNMLNLPSSTILRDVRNPVCCVFVWATLLSVMHRWLTTIATTGRCSGGLVLSGWWVGVAGGLARNMCLPTVQHSMMVSAMSFLLVFRTNSAYQRFAEGRKIWNDIVDTTRDFSRMLKLYEAPIGTSKCRRLNNLLASFPYLLRHRIRPSLMTFYRVNDSNVVRDPENSLLLYPDESLRDTDPEVAALAYDEEETGTSRRKTRELCWVDKRTLPWKLIPGSALAVCARAQNRPLWVCDRMAKELVVVEDMAPRFTNRERMALLAFVDKLSRSIGACERIHQTVVPLNYARHALRSLTVWLWTLPFVLVKDLGLLTGPVVAVLSWILFGVYEIGSRIEDPFQGTLRLSIYCDAIRRDVLADAIARDTAFDLEEKGKSSADEDADYDAILELESASEHSSKNRRKKKRGDWNFGF